MVWHAVVGSRELGTCTCPDGGASIAGPHPKPHPETCALVVEYLRMMKIVSRLALEDGTEGIVIPKQRGAGELARTACDVLGIRYREEAVPAGSEPFSERARARSRRILDRAKGGKVIAVYAPGPESPGTHWEIEEARRRGMPVFVWHNGRWK